MYRNIFHRSGGTRQATRQYTKVSALFPTIGSGLLAARAGNVYTERPEILQRKLPNMTGTHFFITGGTGLIGTNLLPRIHRAYPDATMTLLVRAGSDEEAAARLDAIITRLDPHGGMPSLRRSLHAVRGDTTIDRLGLSADRFERMVRDTTHIIHGAATIRFDHPIDEARRINCGGTERMLTMAGQCIDRGRLERFVYIGTSSVSGQRGGNIYEDELEMGQTFFNTYEQSKCESERLVRNAMNRVPAVIFRPSIVIGDSQTGRTTSFNVIYIPLRLLERGLLSFVPGTPDTTLDLVPVDWVDDVMVHILGKADAIGTICHVTAGPSRAARLGDVVMRAREYFDTHAPLRHPRTVEFITRAEFDRRRAASRGREETLLSQLDTLLPYVTVNRLFNSAHTDRLLDRSGITFPRFSDYDSKIFGYCLRTKWGKTEG